MHRSRQKAGFGIGRDKSGCLGIGGQRTCSISSPNDLAKREPGVLQILVGLGAGLELGSSTKILLCLRVAGLRQDESEIQRGLEGQRICRDCFAIGVYRLRPAPGRVVEQTQIEPCAGVLRLSVTACFSSGSAAV
jgi:hypothetical protein